MLTPVIETDRIILRPLKITDAVTIYNNWASDPEVAKYMRWTLHGSVNDTIEWLTDEEANIEKENNYTWGFVLRENGDLFGSGSLMYSEGHGMFELGYNIMKKYWNRGLTTEASRAMISFAAGSLDAGSLFAVHAKENTASGRVLEKLGFAYQRDGETVCFDGKRVHATREYLLDIAL